MVYVPFYAQIDRIPESYNQGSLFRYDPEASFWAFCVVGNWAAQFYNFVHPLVADAQAEIENKWVGEEADFQARATEAKARGGEAALRDFLTTSTEERCTQAVKTWQNLFRNLITQFHDGYHMKNLHGSAIDAQSLFYPKWWLERVGYFGANVKNSNDALSVKPSTTTNTVTADKSQHQGLSSAIMYSAVVAVVFTLVGIVGGHFYYKR